MFELTGRVMGHFVRLTEIGMHVNKCYPEQISSIRLNNWASSMLAIINPLQFELESMYRNNPLPLTVFVSLI